MFIREMKEKPRERLLEYGVGSLSDSELLAIIIGKGTSKEGTNNIILVHNHPSGDLTPSQEDKEVTKLLLL